MFDVEVQVDDAQAMSALVKLERDTANLEPMLRQMILYYRMYAQREIFDVHRNAAKSGGGGGEHPAWTPLSEEYLKSKRKRVSPHPNDIMQRTGALRRDLTTRGPDTVEEYRRTNDGFEAVFGTSKEYPVWAGGGRGGGRQVMYLTPRTIREFERLAQAFLRAAANSAMEQAA
jgi:hypothetical protein